MRNGYNLSWLRSQQGDKYKTLSAALYSVPLPPYNVGTARLKLQSSQRGLKKAAVKLLLSLSSWREQKDRQGEVKWKSKFCILEMSWADQSLPRQLAEKPKLPLQPGLPVLLPSKTAQVSHRVGSNLTNWSERLLLCHRVPGEHVSNRPLCITWIQQC